METEEQWNWTPEERADLVAKAQAWQGTQREFAEAHGIAQATVSRWLGAAPPNTRTEAERAALVAEALAWQGTQREFADAHGICQSTVSKWLSAAPTTTRPATADLRAEVVERYRAGEGSQRQIADAMGVSRGMVFKWLAAEGVACPPTVARRTGRRPLVLRPMRLSAMPRVPTMLEVVATPTPSPPATPVSTSTGGACLTLPGGAELRFDGLPPARWVAELVAELGRC